MSDIDQLNGWEGFFEHIITDTFRILVNCDSKIIAIFTGNQFGKTDNVAKDYVLRIMGIHPVEKKNIRPHDRVRTFRFCSNTLPSDVGGGEVRNTQYPAFKRRLPNGLIKKDINSRRPVIQLYDPQGGPDINIEFVSFNQEVQSTAGVQRRSVWIDENCGQEFFDEQVPRLLAADGDLIMTYTPTPGSSGWEFDSLYERASTIYRSPAVCKRIYERTDEKFPIVWRTDSKEDITVIMAATDDNPTLSTDVIEGLFTMYDDEDVIDARRYGLFRQLSGRVFKSFNKMHIIRRNEFFPTGLPHDWVHARGIDCHPKVPWACGFIALSPNDEAFIYDELNPSPEKFVSYEISKQLAFKSGEQKYALDLIDPWSTNKQPNSGLTLLEDLNRYFWEWRKEGICQGAYFQTWDTHGDHGRDLIRQRLNNSIRCGVPFNNLVEEHGRKKRLPTLWVLDNCTNTVQHFKNWRMEEWANRDQLLTKDEKDKPQAKWSHFPMVYEGIMKSPAFSVSRYRGTVLPHDRKATHLQYKRGEHFATL